MAEVYRLCEIITPQIVRFDWYPCFDWETQWWNEDIFWYLQQKFYLERWDWNRLPKIVFPSHRGPVESVSTSNNGGYLLAVSGGKESTFAWEWLRRAGLRHETATLHHSGGVYGVGWESKFPVFDLIRNDGILHEFRMYHDRDPALQFNYLGLRNDPTITNILFIMLFIAQGRGLQYLAMANDKSAEEANASHQGKEVNHQSAKGQAYINRFNSFLDRKGISSRYVSLCESVYSIGAVHQLNRWNREALRLISSCNEAQWQSGTTRWCQACSKCAFTYAILEAVAGREFAMDVIGEDLILRPDLSNIWASLFDVAIEKPFECVGEKREVSYALGCISRARKKNGEPLGFLGNYSFPEDSLQFLTINFPNFISKKDQKKLTGVLESMEIEN